MSTKTNLKQFKELQKQYIESSKKVAGDLVGKDVKTMKTALKIIDKYEKLDDGKIYLNTKTTTEAVSYDDYPTLYKYKHNMLTVPKKLTKKQILEVKQEVSKNIVGNKKKLGKAFLKKRIDDGSDIIHVRVTYTVKYYISTTVDEHARHKSALYHGENNIESMKIFAENYARDWARKSIDQSAEVYEFEVNGFYEIEGQKEFRVNDMKLYQETPISLINFFGSNIDNNEGGDCIKNALTKINNTKKLTKTDIDNLEEGMTVDELFSFLKKKKLCNIIYDIDGNVLNKYCPEVANKKYDLIGLAYNEHLYILKNTYINSIQHNDFTKMKKVFLNGTDIKNKFISIIKNNNALPANLKVKGNYITSFVHNDKYYVYNPEFKEMYNVLEQYGIEDKAHPSLKSTNIHQILCKLFIKSNYKSFFPFNFKKTAYNYSITPEQFDSTKTNKKIFSFDMSKCHSNILKNLEYLLQCNYMYSVVNTNPSIADIKENYIYNVKIKYDSLLLHESGLYTGELLLYALKHGAKFELLQSIECTKIDNCFTEMITSLYKKIDGDLAKSIVNKMVGNFKPSSLFDKEEKVTLTKYCPDNNIDFIKNTRLELNGDLYNFECDVKPTIAHVETCAPIFIQILDKVRMEVFEFMKNNNIKNDDVIAIYTDNVVFYADEKPTNYDQTRWRECEFNEDKLDKDNREYQQDVLIDFTRPAYVDKFYNENVLFNSYAGCGKTYLLKNNILPKIKDDILLLTPTQASLKELREIEQDNIECNVIQTYTQFYGEVKPNVRNIIVDEVGMCSYEDFLFLIKHACMNRRIFCLGDFNQLSNPTSEQKMPTKTFLKSLFGRITRVDTNYRNNFTIEQYDEIINNNLTGEIMEKYKKYYSSTHEDTLYIAYRNEVCIKKNLEILHSMDKYEYPENATDYKEMMKKGTYTDLVGVKCICKSNRYGKEGIFNNFKCTIVEHEENTVTVQNDDDEEATIKIRLSVFLNNFLFGYCVNLYCVQGQSIEHFNYLEEDYKYLNSRSFYVLVSRYKCKLNNKTIERNNKISIDF